LFPEPLKVEGEDLPLNNGSSPLQERHWQKRHFKKGVLPSPSQTAVTSELEWFWLPKNRTIANHLIDMYFKRLNFHRPIFEKDDFKRRFDALYSSDTVTMDDPGFICSMYLILALATLSELHQPRKEAAWIAELKADWPTHEDLLSRALIIKPELRVTMSSLQALLLLHWYLYSEVCPFHILVVPILTSIRSDMDDPYGDLSATWCAWRSNSVCIMIPCCKRGPLPRQSAHFV